MRYWVVDSETTGVESQDKAVEVAGFFCEDNTIIDHYQSLVNPGIPIPPQASAIHHLVDDDVKDAPSIEDAMAPFFDQEFDFVVAHNAAFDKRFMDFGQAPWACTWKLAMRVYPDAPSHSNQFLRYFLKLPSPVHAKNMAPHRAPYDSEVSTYLFQHLLSKATTDEPLEAMLKVSNNPLLLKKCGFGKHKGQLWSDVPRSYLDFILHKSSGWDENVLHTARHYYGS
jgi:exodeoxyribonuclease X